MAYRAAGGTKPILLLHDRDHGEALIDAAARFGDGLPAHVLPLAVNEIGQVGLEALAAAFAYGATSIRFLTRAKPRHPLTGLEQTMATANAILAGLGYGAEPTGILSTDDPDALIAALRGLKPGTASPRPSAFMPLGAKRDVMKLALREVHRAAPAPLDTIPLPKGRRFRPRAGRDRRAVRSACRASRPARHPRSATRRIARC